MFDPSKPHNALPKLPPAVKVETEATLRALGDAKAALAALREAGRSLPDQSVILQSMILQEAKLSSEIENIFTTNDELYKPLGGAEQRESPALKEVHRYKAAMWAGYNSLRKHGEIEVGQIKEIASIVLERDVDFRNRAGTVVGNFRTGKRVYTPTEGSHLIDSLMENLVRFMRAESPLDPLTRIAIAHYQFEAIHPFEDGNGRTGRILNILYMVQMELLDLPVLCLSQELLDTRSEYYARLRAVTEQGQWEDWAIYFLRCVESTAVVTRRQFRMIDAAVQESRQEVRERLGPRFPLELVDLVYSKPYTRISDLVEAGIAKRQTASIYLRQLEALGLLRATHQWREVLYLNERLLRILSLSDMPN